MPARSPFVERIMDAVVPATARWLVAFMRQLEEATTDPAARWELLRRRLEQLAGEGRG
jgi:hypothetical protein